MSRWPKMPAAPGMKVCRVCKKELPVEMFSAVGKKSWTSDGLFYCCKPCHNEAGRKYRRENVERIREQDMACWLPRRYGITYEQYQKMLADQGGACAICGTTESRHRNGVNRLSVDHNHETGAVRGLLCNNCNHAIGGLREDPVLFQRAVDYLKKYQSSK